MRIQFDNTSLNNIFTEDAFLKELSITGNDVTLSIDDNNNFVDDDYVIVGSPMNPKTEIAQINDVVVFGDEIRVDNLTFEHNPSDKVFRLQFNQVGLYHADTLTGVKTLDSYKDIDIDDRFTEFEVSDNATGYYFFVMYNESSLTESGYSSGIPITDLKDKSLNAIRAFIEVFYPDDLSDTKLRLLTDDAIEEIDAYRKWRWREGSLTFTSVTDQYIYDIRDDLGIFDFGQMLTAQTDTEPIKMIDNTYDNYLQLNPISLVSNTIFEWAGAFHLGVDGGETVNIKYYKNANYLIESGDETSVKFIGAIGYHVLQNLYLTSDERLSRTFERKFDKRLLIMKRDDEKVAGNITSLNEASHRVKDVTPNIIPE